MLFVFLVVIISAFWGCGGGVSSKGSGDILGSDAIGDSQVAMDSSIQDIQSDTEPQSDINISDAVEDVTEDIKDVVEDIQDVSDSGLDVSDISDCGKTDSRHLWSKSFGGSDDDEGYSVSVDSSGNVYITGGFGSSTIDFGEGVLINEDAGWYDIFLARFDSNGNHLWSKRFGGDYDDWGFSVSVDSSGNVYITGYFKSSTIDFGGGALTRTGTCDEYGRCASDIFLAKFDSNGNHKWSKRFGGSDLDEGNSVSVDSAGNVYGTGSFGGSNIDFGGCPLSSAGWMDIFLIKYKP